MNILTFEQAEKYLRNKQVYFKKEIADSNLKTVAKSDKVHNVSYVEIVRLNESTIAFDIEINKERVTIYEYRTDLEFFAWLRQNFIPVSELLKSWYSYNKN